MWKALGKSIASMWNKSVAPIVKPALAIILRHKVDKEVKRHVD